MSKVNYHGLTIKGLRKASGSTVNWAPRSSGYDEIFYDLSTGEVWTVAQVSLGCNSWTEYHDKNVIKICNTSRHMTMQEISDAIYISIHAPLAGRDRSKYRRERRAEKKRKEDDIND